MMQISGLRIYGTAVCMAEKCDSRCFGLSLLANYGGEGDQKKSKDWSHDGNSDSGLSWTFVLTEHGVLLSVFTFCPSISLVGLGISIRPLTNSSAKYNPFHHWKPCLAAKDGCFSVHIFHY